MSAQNSGTRSVGKIAKWWLIAAVALMGAPAYAVDGFNMPGSDYDNFVAGSSFVCRNSCGGDSKCQGWTWVKPGIQGPEGHCWLKHSLPNLVRDNCCASGSHKNISRRDVRAEDKTDRPGLDYRNFVTDSWKTCEATCDGAAQCRAWAYARPGLQGPSGRCWLKNAVPHPFVNANTVSGVKFKPASVLIDEGTNLVPANE